MCENPNSHTLEEYKTIAGDKGKYILDYSPRSCSEKINGWICNECSQCYFSSYNVIQQGHWCNCIKNKTETKMRLFLQSNFENIIKEYKPEWGRNPITKHLLSYDFYLIINNICIIIELDGSQHFKNINFFNTSAEKTRHRDVYKMKKALENNCFILRLFQEDVLYDKDNWAGNLLFCINEIIKGKHNPLALFISTKDIYKEHKEDMINYDNLENEIIESLKSVSL